MSTSPRAQGKLRKVAIQQNRGSSRKEEGRVKMDIGGRQPPCLKHLPAQEAKGCKDILLVQGRGVGQGGKVKRG